MWLHKQEPRFAQGQPNGCSNECWMKVRERWVCWVQIANMWQHCSLTAVQRKTACVEESWWPEFNLSGSMPWCSFPWHKHLPSWRKITVIRHSKTDPWVYICVFNQPALCRFAKESLPTEIGKGRHWTSVFFCGCASNAPRFVQGQPNGNFQMKELDRTTEPIARMNVEWNLEKAEFAEFNLPTCGNIAVWQLCRGRQPLWKSHDGLNLTCLDQCHGVRSHGTSSSQADAKELLYSLQSKFDPYDYIYIHLHPCFQPACFM